MPKMVTVGMLVDVKLLWTTVCMSSSSMDELSLTSAKQSMQMHLYSPHGVTLAAMTHLVINSPRPHYYAAALPHCP